MRECDGECTAPSPHQFKLGLARVVANRSCRHFDVGRVRKTGSQRRKADWTGTVITKESDGAEAPGVRRWKEPKHYGVVGGIAGCLGGDTASRLMERFSRHGRAEHGRLELGWCVRT